LACEATGFEPEYVVDTLRVLAVQADAPIAAPGDTVHFTTLWADPNGGGRPVAWAWGTCVNPGSSQVPDCVAAMKSIAPGGDSFQAMVPSDALDAVPVGELGVVFAACAGTIALTPNAATGAPVTCTDSNGAVVGRDGFVWGGTRVVILAGATNANPAIDSVSIDGQPWGAGDAPALATCAKKNVDDCAPETQHVFSYTAPSGSAETYDVGLGPQTEELVGWFCVSQGSLTAGYASEDVDDGGTPIDPPTFEMTFTPTLADTSRPLQVWLVLRDDRGGLSFTERHASWK
jgi:hypothetical protein